MTTGDVLLVAGIVLCALAFAALAVTLVRVRDTLGDAARRGRRDACRDGAARSPTCATSTDGAREVIDEARSDLARFDRVLGSAEAIERHGDAGPHDAVGADDQGRRAGDGHVAGRAPVAEGRVMRRAVWFVGGVAAGVAGAGYAKRKVTVAARRLAPSNVARGARLGSVSAPAGASPTRSARAATPRTSASAS